MKKINSILLIDDDAASNFLHKYIIETADCSNHIKTCTSGHKALEYLLNNTDKDFIQPDLIFLDINMPGMNGWEFLEEYEKLTIHQKAKIVIVMLTSSINPDDNMKAQMNSLVDNFVNKPLSKEILNEIIDNHF